MFLLFFFLYDSTQISPIHVRLFYFVGHCSRSYVLEKKEKCMILNFFKGMLEFLMGNVKILRVCGKEIVFWHLSGFQCRLLLKGSLFFLFLGNGELLVECEMFCSVCTVFFSCLPSLYFIFFS